MKRLLLGIDIGTSSCKVAVFEEDGTVVVQSSSNYPLYTPETGWVEQEPDEWWEAVCRSVKECLADDAVDPADIAAIGLAGQGWSVIPVDRNGRVLGRTPIWMDTRASEIVGRLKLEIPDEEVF